ncbi:uncharacterized protein G2W53_031755 [Senna tora]|uniref:Uncharacterized protein n=1 Tax=Senna tora TaxID=362788 RepID=A0A834T6J9_9FABA|nr:uncharacterized protein G2W53_031755 [Senna tora]
MKIQIKWEWFGEDDVATPDGPTSAPTTVTLPLLGRNPCEPTPF